MTLEFGFKLGSLSEGIGRLDVRAGWERVHVRVDENLTADER
jgi:hypothetical protein